MYLFCIKIKNAIPNSKNISPDMQSVALLLIISKITAASPIIKKIDTSNVFKKC
jgi:hypothetical protein